MAGEIAGGFFGIKLLYTLFYGTITLEVVTHVFAPFSGMEPEHTTGVTPPKVFKKSTVVNQLIRNLIDARRSERGIDRSIAQVTSGDK